MDKPLLDSKYVTWALPQGSLAENLFYKTLGTIVRTFEDPTGTARPLWRDYSRWQWPDLNLAVAIANGVLGAFHRAGISWGYIDPWANAFLAQAAGYGSLYQTTYHVLYADQPVLRQADEVWYRIQPEPFNFPKMIDLEVDRGIANERYADATWQMSELVLSRDGTRPIIYSRKGLIDKWLSPFWTAAMLNDHFYCLAQYLWDRTREHAGPPALPNGVLRERVILHQTADKKPAFPNESGGTSYADYDRWEIGNESEMHRWIAEQFGGQVPEPEPEPPPIPDDLPERVVALESQMADVRSAIALLSDRVLALEEREAQNDQPPEPPSQYLDFWVTADKANARFVSGLNNAGRPIMQIYPSDSAPVSERVQYVKNTLVPVYPESVLADGGGVFYKIVHVPDGKPELYLRAIDGSVS